MLDYRYYSQLEYDDPFSYDWHGFQVATRSGVKSPMGCPKNPRDSHCTRPRRTPRSAHDGYPVVKSYPIGVWIIWLLQESSLLYHHFWTVNIIFTNPYYNTSIKKSCLNIYDSVTHTTFFRWGITTSATTSWASSLPSIETAPFDPLIRPLGSPLGSHGVRGWFHGDFMAEWVVDLWGGQDISSTLGVEWNFMGYDILWHMVNEMLCVANASATWVCLEW